MLQHDHDDAVDCLRVENIGLACFISHILHLSSFYGSDKIITTGGCHECNIDQSNLTDL